MEEKESFLKGKLSWIIIIAVIIILSITRIAMITNLPVFAYIDYVDDDELMVQQAKSILSGNWLGEYYSYNTLLKGPVFPLYLAFLNNTGVPYLLGTTIIYAFVSLIFIFSLKDIIKNKWVLLITYVVLLFNPIMFSVDFQRVYRNGLSAILAVLMISFYNVLLINSKEGKLWKYIIACVFIGIIFPFFYYNREDSMWIIPFMIFYSLIIAIKIIKELIKNKKVFVFIVKILFILMPILTIGIFRNVVGNINYNLYGARVVNVNDFEGLNRALHMISIVRDDSIDKPYTNSRAKIKKLYEISPSLNSIKDKFEISLDIISGKEGGEVKNGMFSWTLLTAVQESGYNTFKEQDEVLNKIADEIDEAIKENRCDTQEMVPVFNDVSKKEFSMDKMLKQTIKAFNTINNYSASGTMDTYGSLYDSGLYLEKRVRLFLEVTKDRVLLNDEDPVYESGLGELVKKNQEEYISKMEPKVNTLKTIRSIYTVIFKVLKYIGYISYIAVTILIIILLVKKNFDFLDNWFMLSGLAGSILTLCLGIAYTSVTKVVVTIPFYLMSGYLLNMAFVILSITTLVFMIIKLARINK